MLKYEYKTFISAGLKNEVGKYRNLQDFFFQFFIFLDIILTLDTSLEIWNSHMITGKKSLRNIII